jgi:hypothetical protein
MFGRMMASPVVQFDPGVDLPAAVAALVKLTQNVEIVRWIELSAAVLLFHSYPAIRNLARSMPWIARKEFDTRSISRTNSSAATAQPSLTPPEGLRVPRSR